MAAVTDNNAQEALVRQETDPPDDGWDDARGRLTWRTLFSADRTPTGALVTGVAEIPTGGFLALHRHEQPETYYVLSGTGTVTLDGREHPVRAGTTVFVPGDAEHGVRNDADETLQFFYALAADRFTDVHYRFS